MSEREEALRKAREERSLKKRRAVEYAISELKERGEKITFKNIATLANVSRPYLYNNFKEQIEALRNEDRQSSEVIEGVKVPSRTKDESKHIEALLRNKIERLKKELGDSRRENARLRNSLEKERGKSEHFRALWIKSRE